MAALATITDQMRRSFDGDAWHGPAVMEILKGVTARQAAAKPLSGAHSIWELVLHLTTWSSVVTRRLKGEALEPTAAEDYPAISDQSEAAWQRAVESLRRTHDALLAAVERLPESRLADAVPGKPYSFEFMLLGVVQHDLYHAGQIALLKKAFK
ncbi:MAG TPA: DinB family protein [Terriglobales bacterium]|nr:DinB family protein [Terriglobales bacterium]